MYRFTERAAPITRNAPDFATAAEMARNTPPNSQGRRDATFAASSYDAQAHTVEMILSTGADVRRWGFIERLLIDPSAVDVTRVAAGAVKVLDSHNAWDTDKIIGTIISTRFSGGVLLGTMKFAETPFAVGKEGMVARGELTSVSVGYDVTLWRSVEIITDPNSGAEVTVWRADAWTLMEVSFVSVPADPAAGVRSAVNANPDNQSANSGGATEEENMLTRSSSGAPAPGNPAPAGVTRFSAHDAVEFVELARGFSDNIAERARALVAQNTRGEVGTQACRDALLRAAGEEQRAATAGAPAGTAASVHVLRDEGDVERRAIREALISRMTGNAPSEIARPFCKMQVLDMVKSRMRASGARDVDFLSPTEKVRAMHTVSDFPQLMTGAVNAVLMDTYAASASALKAVSRRSSYDDFAEKKIIKLGPLPVMPLVLEGGEIKNVTVAESGESTGLHTYAWNFSLSLQVFMNDSLGAWGGIVRRAAQAASDTEAALLTALLTANNGAGPKLSDGQYLFSAAHGNLAQQGGAIGETTLSDARLAMRTQKAIDGKALSPVAPATLIVGPTKETEGEKVLSTLAAGKTEDTNVFAGKLALGVEARLPGNGWYVFGDPALSPVIEYAYLTGDEGPRLDTREGWEVLGIDYRLVLHFGCGIVDHRGAYRNPGNAPAGQ